MKTNVSGFWRYLSSFFNYLEDRSRESWEFIWEGMTFVANEMTKQAARFLYSSAPERSYLTPTIDFYDVALDVLKARPTNIDLTQYKGRYTLVSKGVIKSAPTPIGRETTYNDMVELGKDDYDAIRNVAIGQYAVIDDEVQKRYFKVSDTLGPTETGTRLFDKYVLKLEGANLSYISASAKISVYLTTGKVFKVGVDVIDIPFLYTRISDNESRTFQKDVDYTFSDSYIEFSSDIIGNGMIENGTIVYGKDVPVMETNLFNAFGALVDLRSWKTYNNDNISAKAAINVLLRGLQNPSSTEEYEGCLNIYYGMPVSPDKATVIGLFESYDYEITAINTPWVTLALKPTTTLHKFLQPGTKLIIDGTDTLVNIVYSNTESSVINRTTGEIKLNATTGLSVGSILNIKLPNKMNLIQVAKPLNGRSYFKCPHHTAGGEFEHISNYINTNFPNKFPELLVYDSRTIREVNSGVASYFNQDAYYHFVSCTKPADGYINFTVDDNANSSIEEPRYNDFVDLSPNETIDVSVGKVHIPWPTHKYLLLRLSDGIIYKCYIDAPIDTIYCTGDVVEKYQVLGRCASVMDKDVFANWNEFSGFRRNNGIDPESNMLELIYTIPFAKYGFYFPN
jgi:hypothetical protein